MLKILYTLYIKTIRPTYSLKIYLSIRPMSFKFLRVLKRCTTIEIIINSQFKMVKKKGINFFNILYYMIKNTFNKRNVNTRISSVNEKIVYEYNN